MLLLWFGWFGFIGASAFAADGVSCARVLNTMVAPAAAMISWMLVERLRSGKADARWRMHGHRCRLGRHHPRLPASLMCGPLLSWASSFPICYSAMAFLKPKLGYDDALDAFGCHGIGGMVGGVLTGIFCVPDLSPGPTSAACCTPVIPRCSSLRLRASISPSCSLL